MRWESDFNLFWFMALRVRRRNPAHPGMTCPPPPELAHHVGVVESGSHRKLHTQCLIQHRRRRWMRVPMLPNVDFWGLRADSGIRGGHKLWQLSAEETKCSLCPSRGDPGDHGADKTHAYTQTSAEPRLSYLLGLRAPPLSTSLIRPARQKPLL